MVRTVAATAGSGHDESSLVGEDDGLGPVPQPRFRQSLTEGPTLRAASGSVLYLALIALLALGVGTALRSTSPPIEGSE